MKPRLLCNRVQRLRATRQRAALLLWAVLLGCLAMFPKLAMAGDVAAPAWMHALTGVPLPAHDEKTDAVLLYSEKNVTVLGTDKVKISVRRAYKILRPGGREYGLVLVDFNPRKKVTGLRGWCIPAQGKDFEVKDKDAVEVALPKIEGSELISDVKDKMLRIPAPDPGNIVGYEYEVEEQPMVLQDTWRFQHAVPARESHYSLSLPPGWELKALWLNYPEAKASESGNQWQWTVNEVSGVREEDDMPPLAGVMGQMVVSWFPPGGSAANVSSWTDMGAWYGKLTNGRRDASPEIKKQVVTLTSSLNTPLEKMRAIAQFLQHDVRYVGIYFGIGGYQPHAASDTYQHRYGDCKDKATLMSSMLHEIGIDSYYVVINSRRGSVGEKTPPHVEAFDHVILAIKLPDGVVDSSLLATAQDPKLGRILFFDPTNELTPFGKLSGHLQANYGLLVTPDGGELVKLPEQAPSMNGVLRSAKLTLDPNGTLKGDVKETRVGDRASAERWELRAASDDKQRIKPIENLLAGSLPNFQITSATLLNLQHSELPFGFNYSFIAENYAKNAGDLLLVRPRVLGVKASGLLETKEPRKYPVEFNGPDRDTDSFEITIPSGFQVDEIPEPVNADYEFASYHSKTEVNGSVIHYTRTFEVKELSVPISSADDLKKLYRTIAADERNMVVLKQAAK